MLLLSDNSFRKAPQALRPEGLFCYNVLMHEDYSFWFWPHLIFNTFFIFSWFLFSWWFILIAGILLSLQFKIIGGCVLSKLEFGDATKGCIADYLVKWGIGTNEEKIDNFVSRYLAISIFVLSLVWQVLLNFKPFLF